MHENKSLEFKLDITNSFLKTVSAYANFGTGIILFGVKDDGTICGVAQPERLCLDIENKINDNISPKPEFSLRIREQQVVELEVLEGPFKPYFYKNKAYRRSDTASIEVDTVELKRLVLAGSNMSYEELPTETINLSFNALADKLGTALGIGQVSEDVLRTLGLINKDRKYNKAAEIFADENSFSGIDIARFGNSLNEILDRETVVGTSVLAQYDKAIDAYRKYYQYEKIDGIQRILVENVPEIAFREAVANALVHRSWDRNINIRIAMFPDRIEIVSPGGLPQGITKEEYLKGYISYMRNPIIGNIFYRLRYIEMFGTGIRRIVATYAESMRQPEFIVSDNSISVILPVVNLRLEVSSDELKLIKLLESGIILSNSEMVKATGTNKAKIGRLIKSLLEKGYVKQLGNGRGTRYCLSKAL